MKKIAILHLSDAHISTENVDKIEIITKKVIDDVKKLLELNNAELKIICFTGDLCNKASNGDTEYSLAIDKIIYPLISNLNIEEENFFIVPGNHDIDISSIDKVNELGLTNLLTNSNQLDDYIKKIETQKIERIHKFNEFKSLLKSNYILSNDLYTSHIVKLDKLKIGIACINSAWRSTGCGAGEKTKLLVGKRQLDDCYKLLEECEIKICLMHHPTDWLADFEKIDIDMQLSKFDIVLKGHIHINDTKQIYTYTNGNTIHNVCGKLYPTEDYYNGYSVLILDNLNNECKVLLRQYYYQREEFDKALNICPDGEEIYKLNGDILLDKCYKIICNIKKGFYTFISSFLIPNVLSNSEMIGFDDAFVEPVLNKNSEYNKEITIDKSNENSDSKDNDGFISLDEVFNIENNILFIGKKESGKTTILHKIVKIYLDNYDKYGIVPILINCEDIPAGKDIIEKSIHNFINFNICENYSINLQDIKEIIKNKKIVLIFDNVDKLPERAKEKFNEFLNTNNENKYIFSITESFIFDTSVSNSVKINCSYDEIYLRYMSKKQIRELTKIHSYKEEDSKLFMNNLMKCLNSTNLPKTPFVVSLVIAVCNNIDDSTPVNEATILEQFMEMLLEKISKEEVKSKTYDFKIKEHFLSSLAKYMDEKHRFYLDYEEFHQFLLDYHKEKGFRLELSKFDRIFFDKNILINITGKIYFRFHCMFEYYLAKYAIDNEDYLNKMLEKANYLSYVNEMKYYAGISRNNKKLLNHVNEYLETILSSVKNKELLKTIDNYKVDISFFEQNEEDLKKNVEKGKLTTIESDNITDRDSSNCTDNFEDNRQLVSSCDTLDELLGTIILLGYIVKNSELLNKDDKIEPTKTYMLGLSLLLLEIKNRVEEKTNKFIEQVIKKGDSITYDKYVKDINLIKNLINLVLPCSVQNLAADNIGTNKLDMVLLDIIHGIENYNDINLFIYLFIYCDLRMNNFMVELKNYINKVDSKMILEMIQLKLIFYYKFNYFSSTMDDFLLSLIGDVQLKINNTSGQYRGYNKKNKIIDNIKSLPRYDKE